MGMFWVWVMIVIGCVWYAGLQLWRVRQERALPPDQRTTRAPDGPLLVASTIVFCAGVIMFIAAIILVDPTREANIGAGIAFMTATVGAVGMTMAFVVSRLGVVARGIVSLVTWLFIGWEAHLVLLVLRGLLEEIG